MIYTTKEECYQDVLISLTSGLLLPEDLRLLKGFYEETEQYECCQGILEAYIDYERVQRNSKISSNHGGGTYEFEPGGED